MVVQIVSSNLTSGIFLSKKMFLWDTLIESATARSAPIRPRWRAAAAIRARRSKVTTGTAGMMGLTGRAQTALAPEGTVFVRGELWRARSPMNVSRGEPVRVTGMHGLTLDVEAERNDEVVPRKTSAVDQ